jgi:predicted transcriptional regulator
MSGGIILYEYEEVLRRLRELRDEQNISQKEIAERVRNTPNIDISDAHLSRTLRGEREASYTKIYQIWKVLQEEAAGSGVTATELMNAPIEWAHPDETVRDVAEQALENAYTQLPVREDDEHVGWITTERLADEDPDSPIRSLVHSEGFTTVPPFLDQETILDHLQGEYRAILVAENGDYQGIITYWDLTRHTVENR